MSKYVVRIDHDPDTESPSSYDCNWRVYSFNTRHINHKDPSEFFDDAGKPQLWFANKLRVGLAHILSYYEHGNCVWSLQGTGPQCQFDSVGVAGVAVWEDKPSDIGAKTISDRADDCARFLKEYTDWCNGNCYWYAIEKMATCPTCGHEDDDETIDSCGGFIGEDAVCEAIRDNIPEDATPENTKITGDAKCIAEYNDIFPVKKQLTAE
jgi:hypothetical protein